MADVLTPEARSQLMQRVRTRNTKPEVAVRRLLHHSGFRFRLHRKDLPGRPDVVLPKYCVAVFVHGCFWHGHDCPKGRRPTTNVKFWNDKLHENRERDRRKKAELEQLGWRVITVWECETKDPAELSSRLEDTIRGGEQ